MHCVTNSARNIDGFSLIEVVVALSLLALGVAGFAQLRHQAYRHLTVTEEIQQASYFADSHLSNLGIDENLKPGLLRGEYSRGLGIDPYPWELDLLPLDAGALRPASETLSDKVRPLRADLSVWVDQGARVLHFHSLVLAQPLDTQVTTLGEVGAGQPAQAKFRARTGK